jgi:DNA mismatch endonuclease (patch repair protein)
MTDVFSIEKRSQIMRKVKSTQNNSTELRLIQFFKDNGIKGWRRNYPLPGKPDFVFPKLRIVIFADGCFWHGHDCRNTKPKQNAEYWLNKIEKNKQRDKEIVQILAERKWVVIRIWECEINKKKFDKITNGLPCFPKDS